MSVRASLTTDPSPVRVGATAAAAATTALAASVLFVAWPSRSRAEIAENAIIGTLLGAVLASVATSVWLATARALRTRWQRTSPSHRAAAAVAAMAAGMTAFLGALAFATGRSFSAFAVLAGPGATLAAACAGVGAAGRSATRAALAIVAVAAVAIGGLAAFGPLDPRPETVRVTDDRPEEDLVVLSWNCGLGNPGAFHSRREDLPAIADAIARSGADVACLQEVGDAHRDILLELLGQPWRGVSNEPANGWGDSVLTRVHAAELFVVTLPHLFRGTAAARLTHAGNVLPLLSVHLSPGAASTWRSEQVASLRDHARTVGYLLAGDLNVDTESPWDRRLAFLTDSIERDRDTESMLATIGVDAGAGTAATAMLSRRIDRIYVPRNWRLVEYRVLVGRKVGRMDHHPIVARIRPKWTPR